MKTTFKVTSFKMVCSDLATQSRLGVRVLLRMLKTEYGKLKFVKLTKGIGVKESLIYGFITLTLLSMTQISKKIFRFLKDTHYLIRLVLIVGNLVSLTTTIIVTMKV